MGFIKSSILVVLSIVLFLSLLLGNLLLIASSSLEYETIQPKLTSIGKNLISESGMSEEIEKNYELILLYCANFKEPFKIEEYNITIPCEVINEGQEKAIEYGINQFIENIYYKEYDCTFIECVKNPETTSIIISQTAKDYLNNKFNLILLWIIFMAILLFLIIKNKTSFLILSGGLTIFSAIPFMKINWILNFFNDELITEIISTLVAKNSYNVFLLMTIIGAGILILGIILKILNVKIQLPKFSEKNTQKEKKDN